MVLKSRRLSSWVFMLILRLLLKSRSLSCHFTITTLEWPRRGRPARSRRGRPWDLQSEKQQRNPRPFPFNRSVLAMATGGGSLGGRPKGRKDNPINPRRKPDRSDARQAEINRKVSEVKKKKAAERREQQKKSEKEKAAKDRPASNFFRARPQRKSTSQVGDDGAPTFAFAADYLEPGGGDDDDDDDDDDVKPKAVDLDEPVGKVPHNPPSNITEGARTVAVGPGLGVSESSASATSNAADSSNNKAASKSGGSDDLDEEAQALATSTGESSSAAKSCTNLPTFLSFPNIRTFDPEDISPNFEEEEDALDIDEEDGSFPDTDDRDDDDDESDKLQAESDNPLDVESASHEHPGL